VDGIAPGALDVLSLCADEAYASVWGAALESVHLIDGLLSLRAQIRRILPAQLVAIGLLLF
jgi:hypothetical protein